MHRGSQRALALLQATKQHKNRDEQDSRVGARCSKDAGVPINRSIISLDGEIRSNIGSVELPRTVPEARDIVENSTTPGLNAKPADVSAVLEPIRAQGHLPEPHARLVGLDSRIDSTNLFVPHMLETSKSGGSSADGHCSSELGLVNKNNVCFAVCDGRVTSLTCTPDGTYIFVAFSSGTVRLYDLSATIGSTDVEDRFGILLDRIHSGHNNSSVVVSLEMGCASKCIDHNITIVGSVGEYDYRALDSTSTIESKIKFAVKNHIGSICHLFVSCIQGSSRILAIDVRSILSIKRQRGFMTGAGLGIKSFVHSDSRVRGLLSVKCTACKLTFSQLDCDSLNSYAELLSDVNANQPSYSITYVLICGKGYGNVNIWNVVLTSQRSLTANLDEEFQHSQTWNLLSSININAPTLSFACFSKIDSKIWLSEIESYRSKLSLGASKDCGSIRMFESELEAELNLNAAGISGNISSCTKSSLALVEDELLDQSSSASQGMLTRHGTSPLVLELLLGAVDRHLRSHAVHFNDPYVPYDAAVGIGPPRPIKSISGILAASDNGLVLFGGLDELIVYKYIPASENDRIPGTVMSTESYSLVVSSSQRRPRHLRQIDAICCTNDGSYAIITCSDNSVFLYSSCDVYGVGIKANNDKIYSEPFAPTSIPEDKLQSDSASISSFQSPVKSSNGDGQTMLQAPLPKRVAKENNRPCTGAGGFLTLLFQAKEQYSLHNSIFFCDINATTGSDDREDQDSNCCCKMIEGVTGTGDIRKRFHRPPNEVAIAISWWKVNSPSSGGVMKISRLVDCPKYSTEADFSGTSLDYFELLPTDICVPEIGLYIISPDMPAKGCMCSAYILRRSYLQRQLGIPKAMELKQPSEILRKWVSSKTSDMAWFIGAKAREACWVCGDTQTCHWKKIELQSKRRAFHNNALDNENEKHFLHGIDEHSARHSRQSQYLQQQPADRKRKSKQDDSGSDQLNSRTEPALTKKRNHPAGSPSTSSCREEEKSQSADNMMYDVCEPSAPDVLNATASSSVSAKIAQLEAEVVSAKAESELILRKADRRFQEEKRMRIAFNVDRNRWEQEKQDLQSKISSLEELLVQRNAMLRSVWDHQSVAKSSVLRYFEVFDEVYNSFNGSDYSSSLKIGSDSTCVQNGSPMKPFMSDYMKVPFCVACQSYTATVCLVPCGHICLCKEHFTQMESLNRLSNCPVCKVPVTTTCKINV